MNLSPQQAAVIEWVKTGKGSAFVEAVAGTGKTSTLIRACAETTGSVAFAAFNKKIADEIAAKVAKLNLGNRIRVGTFHSFGFNAWRRVHPKVQLDERRKAERTLEHLELNERTKPIAPFILKLVSLAKQRAIGLYGAVDDESLWYEIIGRRSGDWARGALAASRAMYLAPRGRERTDDRRKYRDAPSGSPGDPLTHRGRSPATPGGSIMALEDIDGYPFLHLARRHNLDYGDVLLCSDSFIHSPLNVWEREARKRAPKEIQVEILKITHQEMRRKYPGEIFELNEPVKIPEGRNPL